MDPTIGTNLEDLWSTDRDLQNRAFTFILEVTDGPVDWAYEAWDELLENLGHKDNHNRAIAAQVLCNLARSDPQNRMLKDFDALLAVTGTSGSSPPGTACRPCGRSAWRERSNERC